MRPVQAPLTDEETRELSEILEVHAGRTLPFARGVFAAVASAPTRREPTDWLPLLLAEEAPDRPTLRRLFELVLREYAACAQCLALGVPAVPSPDDVGAITQFCKGYVRVSQSDSRWTRDSGAFALTVPLAVLAEYVTLDALGAATPEVVDVPEEDWRARRRENLGEDVARLYSYFEGARKEPPPPVQVEKIGRNEPCPCGSGKKYKKCCGA